METALYTESVEHKYQRLLELEPKLVTATVPSDAAEQKALFIAGEVTNPDHTYPKLDIPDQKIEDIRALGANIVSLPEMPEKHRPVYDAFIDQYAKKTRLMQTMHEIKRASSEDKKDAARAEFMQLNVELYGEPEQATYESLLQEKLANLSRKHFSEGAQIVYDELLSMLPAKYAESHEPVERFKPSTETIEWMHNAVESLYSSLLAHVPEQETFNVEELRQVFETILHDEFAEAAEGWTVDVEPAKSINVKSAEKRIVIPEDRGELSRDTVRKLVVHEIGVHTMRSITGASTDIGPLRSGLVDYYDAEEGLGKVMEQALVGKFGEAGIDHYITAGAAYFDHMDFRNTYELKWRLGALDKVSDGEELTDEVVQQAKNAAYSGVMRMFRGTDELPWFKDLAYYNGSVETWKFLEKINGDDFRLTLLMMGKTSTGTEDLRTVLESRSVV